MFKPAKRLAKDTQLIRTKLKGGIFMFRRSLNPLARTAAGAALAIALSLAATAVPSFANDGPFAGMAGTWTGTGMIAVNDNKERLRCRANYTVSNAGSTVDLSIVCASDSYKFNLTGGVNHVNGAVSGTWSESAHGAAGEISGTAKPGVISARATGAYFSALLSLNTRGNQQSISLNSPGSQISSVTMSLTKGAGPATAAAR